MSDMLDNIYTRNFLNLGLDDAFLPTQSPLKAPGSRLNRSASYFSSPSPSSSSASAARHSLSTEHIINNNNDDDDDDDDDSGCVWPSDIWSQVAAASTQLPFRPERSVSLSEAGSALLSSLGQLAGLDQSSPPGSVAPPPGFPPLSSSLQQCQTPMTILPSNRYKTELCRGYQESGSCKYGSKCQFAHGEPELRGLYRHPKYKTEPCRTFYNFGYCPYGARCHFLHEEKASGPSAGSAKFQRQQSTSGGAAAQNPRHQLRQSVSFGGFLGSSRSSPPPSLPPSAFNDPNLGFSRAPSVSPPPAAADLLLSPAFGDALLQRETMAASAFQFGHRHQHQSRGAGGDAQDLPLRVEPSRCVCGHGKGGGGRGGVEEEGPRQEGLFHGRGGFMKAPALQRFSSEDSLEDSYSSSSGSSSGTESPTFDGSKRLTVFARLSLSD